MLDKRAPSPSPLPLHLTSSSASGSFSNNNNNHNQNRSTGSDTGEVSGRGLDGKDGTKRVSMPPPAAPSPPPSVLGSANMGTAPGAVTSNSAKRPPVVLGICAMDVKARSKAMREIITRLVDIEKGGVEVKIFGDVVILEEGMLTFGLWLRFSACGGMEWSGGG